MNPTDIDWPRRLEESRRQLQGIAGAEALTDLVEMIALPARQASQAVAVCICCHGMPAEIITWGQLWSSARRQAQQFLRDGLRQGDRVVLALPSSGDFLSCFFGAILAGGIAVPAAPPASRRPGHPQLEALRAIALDCGGAFCAAADSALDYLSKGLEGVLPQARIVAPSQKGDPAWKVPSARPQTSDTALLQYTSGSSSCPKGVELSHANLLSNVSAIVDQVIPPQTVGFSWLPLHHDMGLIGCLLTSLASRTPLVLMSPLDFVKNPASWLRGISEFKATITVAPNFAFQYCLDSLDVEGLRGVRLDSLQAMLNGAEPVDAEVMERFEEKFRPLGLTRGVIRPVYGLAENCLAVTFSAADGRQAEDVDADILESRDQACLARPGDRCRRLVSVGPPLSGQRVRIVDQKGQPLRERRVGSILVRSPSVMKGYFNRPAETAEVLRDGWLCTGDLGYLAQGRLFVTGRSKEIIIRHGRNYFPHDLERQVCRLEGVFRSGAAAFSLGSHLREKMILIAETRLRQATRLGCLDRLIREKMQQVFLFGPDDLLLVKPGSIPRTSSGKVQYWKCRQKYLSGGFQQRRAANGEREEEGTRSSMEIPEEEWIEQVRARSHRHRVSSHQDA